jgi:hypothetical protein
VSVLEVKVSEVNWMLTLSKGFNVNGPGNVSAVRPVRDYFIARDGRVFPADA